MKIHVNITLFGKVKHVGFRFYAKYAASKFNISGFITHKKDDALYIEAEGEEEDLKQFIHYCKKGTIESRLNNIRIVSAGMKNHEDFIIVRRPKKTSNLLFKMLERRISALLTF